MRMNHAALSMMLASTVALLAATSDALNAHEMGVLKLVSRQLVAADSARVIGEKFARRFIEIVARDGDLIGIKNGVQPGDRVVTRGAYDIQLASAAKGLPAEGHVH